MIKKLLCIGLAACSAFALIGCGGKNSSDSDASVEITDSSESYEEISSDISKNSSKESVLSTEYTITGYAKDFFAVENSTGILEGVIDINNNVIIPVEYDDVYFLNLPDRRDKPIDEVFFLAKYEDEYYVIDQKGKKIIDGDAHDIEYQKDVFNPQAYFYLCLESSDTNPGGNIVLYDIKGNEIARLDRKLSNSQKAVDSFLWVDDSRFFVMFQNLTTLENGSLSWDYYLSLFDYSFNEIKKWEGYAATTTSGFIDDTFNLGVLTDNGSYMIISVDPSGNISETPCSKEDIESLSQQIKSNEKPESGYSIGDKKQYHIYESNNTWKLEDENGNPLYDKRYYGFGHLDKAYFLTNENDDVCVFTKNGDKVIDYGTMYYNGKTVVYDGTLLDSDNTYADYDSVCVVKNENGLNTARVFRK